MESLAWAAHMEGGGGGGATIISPYYLSGLSRALFFPTTFLKVAVYISLRCTPWDNLLKQLLKANRVIPETQ